MFFAYKKWYELRHELVTGYTVRRYEQLCPRVPADRENCDLQFHDRQTCSIDLLSASVGMKYWVRYVAGGRGVTPIPFSLFMSDPHLLLGLPLFLLPCTFISISLLPTQCFSLIITCMPIPLQPSFLSFLCCDILHFPYLRCGNIQMADTMRSPSKFYLEDVSSASLCGEYAGNWQPS